jgi:putative oxidoreductase
LLLTGRYVPLALTLLAPIVVNIVLFHLFLEPATLALPIILLGLGLYLAWTERAAFAPLFKRRLEVDARGGVARDLAAST